MRRLLAEVLDIENEGGAGSYLCLPECFSGSKQQLLAFIGEKLDKRLNGWYTKMLSLGGKEVLLKSVAMALPVYAMSCFRLTKHHCQKIMSAMAAFWWNESSDKKKIHWIAWEKVCESKENGGLGFRDIEDFNQALLAKQAWKLLNEPNSLLAQVYKGRYYAKTNFLEAGKGSRPSYAWRSILFGRELLAEGLIKSIGTGVNSLVWIDKWIMEDCPRRPVSRQITYDINLRVADLLHQDGTWRVESLVNLFPENEVKRILALHVGGREDKMIWAHTKHGAYTVKSGYWLKANLVAAKNRNLTAHDQRVLDLKKRVWRIPTLPKIRMFLWRVLSGAIAVAERLRSRGLHDHGLCIFCQHEPETINHMLFQCVKAQELWDLVTCLKPPHGFYPVLEDNLNFLFDVMDNKGTEDTKTRSTPWVLWNVWKNRNSLLFAETQESPSFWVHNAEEEATLWFVIKKQAQQVATQDHRKGEIERWNTPAFGTVKCNIHVNWRNATLHYGGAWIARDHTGNVLFHARDAFTPSVNRMVAELRGILWVLRSARDLHFDVVSIASDFREVVDAITKPIAWPRYRYLLEQVEVLCGSFVSVSYEVEAIGANSIARDIEKSVMRDGRFQSYLALGGPAWLHQRISREASRQD